MTDAVVREHFDRVAPEYETNRLGGWYVAHGRFVADHLAGRRFGTAIDVGCGTGWLLRELRRRDLVERGIGLDLARGMIDEARTRAGESGLTGLEFHECDWPSVPGPLHERLAASRPELVLFASSLHYAADVRASLERARELLAPGGLVAILERAPERSLLTRAWGWAHRLLLRDGAEFTSTPELLERLREAGFHDARVAAGLKRWLWRGKMITSMALTTGRAG